MTSKTDRYTKEIKETFVQFTIPGDQVHGKLVAHSAQHMPGGDVGRYTVVNEEGRFTFLGSTQIDHMLGDKRLGYDFKLVFMGTEPTAGDREVKQFNLFEPA